jgi:O-antigen/teichoic acid export membrane protein
VAAVAAGVLIAFFVVSALMGYLIWGAVGALVIAVIVLVIKAARWGRRVSWEEPDREIRESVFSSPQRRQKAPNVDDELARLKREMRN